MALLKEIRLSNPSLMILVFLAGVMAGCAKPEVGKVQISPEEKTLTVGESATFKAVALSTKGEEMPEVAFQWSVEGEAGKVDDAGRFTAEKPGEAAVVAQAAQFSAKAKITVKPKLGKVQISPEEKTLTVGESDTFKAVAIATTGEEMPEVAFQWSVEGEAGKVDNAGRFTAEKPGEAAVVAQAAQFSAKAKITVKPRAVVKIDATPERVHVLPGTTLNVAVKALAEGDRPAGFNRIEVASPTEGTSVAVSEVGLDAAGEGLVAVTVSPKPGENLFVLKSGDVSKEVRIDGTRITGIVIEPKLEQYEAGQRVQFKATGHDDYGNQAPVGAEWSLTSESASLEPDGIVIMSRPGKGILLAEYEGITKGQSFTIVPGELARIRLTPDSAKLKAGESASFSAEGFNAQGYPLTFEPKWTVEGDVGTVSEDGIFIAKREGAGAVKAISGDIVSSAPVQVEHGTISDIIIDLAERQIVAGQTVQLAAQGADGFGNRFPVTPQWFLSKSIGSIDQEKSTFSALRAGTGEIRAMVGNILKGVEVQVVPAELVALQISPQMADMIAGESVQFQVQGFDRFGNSVEIAPEFSIREDLGDLRQDGLFRAIKAGNTVVMARVKELVAEAKLAIAPAGMERVVIDPAGPVDLEAGKAQQFSAFGLDPYGNTVTSAIKWSVFPELGTIDDQGVFFPRRPGKGKILASVTQVATGIVLNPEAALSVSPGQTARIQIEPPKITMVAGEERPLSATAYDQFGNVTGVPITWGVGVPSIGTISPDGVFSAIKADSGKIVASYQNVFAEVDVRVNPAEVAFLKIVPETLSLQGGEKVQLDALGEDRFGNVLKPKILWSVLPDELGRITQEGVLTAGKRGAGSVCAASRNILVMAPLEVKEGPPVSLLVTPSEKVVESGGTLSFRAAASDAGGNEIEIEPEWSVDENLGTIDKGGLFSAKKTGTGEVVARHGDLRGTATVRVVPSKPARVEIQPGEISIAAGDVTHLSFQAFDANGNVISDPPYSWEVGGHLGFMTPGNEFHARKSGTGFIRLTSGEARGQIPVTINAGELSRIQVAPASLELVSGQKEEFTAKGFDAQGNAVQIEPTWSVSGAIGSVDQKAVFEAFTTGEGYITAQVDNVSGVSRITVRPGAVARIRVEPATMALAAGDSASFHATAYDAQGNVTPAEFSWALEGEPGFGEITGPGAISVRKAGGGLLYATAGDIKGRAEITVKPSALRRLTLRPERIDCIAGDAVEIRSKGEDAFGNGVPVAPSFSVEPEALGTIAPGDVFVAQKAGKGMVSALVDDVKASAPVSVKVGELASIQVEAPETEIMAGKTYRFAAVGYDRGGNQVDLDARWAVTPEVGRVEEATGLFHATKAGRGLILAHSGGVLARMPVKVSPGELYNLFIEPNPITVRSDELQAFTLKGLDSEGNSVPVSVSALKWSVLGGIGVFEEPGVLRGTKMGEGKVTASIGDLLAESYVTVVPGEALVSNCRIRVMHPILPADQSAFSEVIMEIRDTHNNPVPGIQATIVSSRQGDTIVQPPKTDDHGLARGRISSSEPGTSTVSAVLKGQAIPDTARVTFE